jgi:hypothetical protein
VTLCHYDIVLNVVMPSDHNVKMNVIMLHVVTLNAIQLSGTLLSVIILFFCFNIFILSFYDTFIVKIGELWSETNSSLQKFSFR